MLINKSTIIFSFRINPISFVLKPQLNSIMSNNVVICSRDVNKFTINKVNTISVPD